ncbi:MAG: hypothetical protein QOE11_1961 [Solirubrobacteraceae bacterium]|jgi:hypothetical protein|nr:hypothetical protein [Solirubrobacteraceae bacterium]
MRRRPPGWAVALGAAALVVACIPALAPLGAAAASRPAVSLAVHYDDGAGHTRRGRLTCTKATQRATGDLAGRVPVARQCARVRALATLLAHPRPTGLLCADIYGGPQSIRVTGKIAGDAVRRRFRRTNGCEIEEFRRVNRALAIVP